MGRNGTEWNSDGLSAGALTVLGAGAAAPAIDSDKEVKSSRALVRTTSNPSRRGGDDGIKLSHKSKEEDRNLQIHSGAAERKNNDTIASAK
ncbi:hypothetical protein RB195_005003 [Necator americanus]|uniref:Uncharacterized protein n=1 Tax=Necator americanus TaxID=51031 RepID=A0ABR1BKQ7_NECAM